MNICIMTVGTRGDTQPYVALGQGLQAAGHRVRLATFTCFEEMIRQAGLDFFPVSGDSQALLNSEEGKVLTSTGKNFLHFMRTMKRFMPSAIEQLTDDTLQALQGMDLLIYSFVALSATIVAEKLRIPALPVFLQPCVRTHAFPNPFFFSDFSLGKTYNYWTYLCMEQLSWQIWRPMVQNVRRRLGLSPYSFWGNAGQFYKQHALCGYSPLVVPSSSDLGERIHITGYWFLDNFSHWQPPTKLVDFLQAGSPPVAIGFGSMTNRDPEKMTALVVQALRRAKQRGILITGWGGLIKTDQADDIFTIEEVPHQWLFPRMAAVVHHGGAGTTAAALRAGIPNVVVPFLADQPFWGHRVATLGVGPKPIPQKQLSVQSLADALEVATQNTQIRSRAIQLGIRISDEQGIERAVMAIEYICRSQTSSRLVH